MFTAFQSKAKDMAFKWCSKDLFLTENSGHFSLLDLSAASDTIIVQWLIQAL